MLPRFSELIVERVTSAAHGANWVGGIAAVERLAQTADMDVYSALVDINLVPPHTIEQLLARKNTAGPLHEKFEQAVLGRPKIHRAAAAGDALLLAIDLQVAEAQHVGDPFGKRAAQ